MGPLVLNCRNGMEVTCRLLTLDHWSQTLCVLFSSYSLIDGKDIGDPVDILANSLVHMPFIQGAFLWNLVNNTHVIYSKRKVEIVILQNNQYLILIKNQKQK